MRMPAAVAMIVVGLVLGFAVTVSPSWLSIGLLGSTLVVAGLAALAIAVMGRVSGARRERWHAAGPILISLGFIFALTGVVLSCVAGYLVSPWRGRGTVSSWLRPPPPVDDDRTAIFHRPYDGELPR